MTVTVVSRVISCLGGVEKFMKLDFKVKPLVYYQGSFQKGGIRIVLIIGFFTFTSICMPLSISKQLAGTLLITA